MSEEYALIKFEKECIEPKPLVASEKLDALVGYCAEFANRGFTRSYEEMPESVRSERGYPDKGSEGNLSYREDGDAFVVTGSQLPTKRGLSSADFAMVTGATSHGNEVKLTYAGTRAPSSESIMHDVIYRTMPAIGAIFHGHDDDLVETFERWLDRWTGTDAIAYTSVVPKPGTRETSDSVIAALANGARFVVIRKHGFVSVGETMVEAFSTYVDGMAQMKKELADLQ